MTLKHDSLTNLQRQIAAELDTAARETDFVIGPRTSRQEADTDEEPLSEGNPSLAPRTQGGRLGSGPMGATRLSLRT